MTPRINMTPPLRSILEALPSRDELAVVVPRVLGTLERDPLACGGRFRGDLLRALMEIRGSYWVGHPGEYERYRVVLRRAAVKRRGGRCEDYAAFWSELWPSTSTSQPRMP